MTGGDGAVLLEPDEAAFDDVAATVGDPIEGGWAPIRAAATLPVGLLIRAFGDRRDNAPDTELGADGARA